MVIIFTPYDDNEVQGGRLIERDFAADNGITVIKYANIKDIIEKLDSYLGIN